MTVLQTVALVRLATPPQLRNIQLPKKLQLHGRAWHFALVTGLLPRYNGTCEQSVVLQLNR